MKIGKLSFSFNLFFITLILFNFISCTPSANEENQTANEGKQKPNVIYILVDQWRASAFGYTGDANVITPNIDSFAAEAVSFPNAVSVTPVCTPHRAALMTGKFPSTTGMIINDLYLPEEELCMAEIYADAGYQTAYFGKWHLDGHGRTSYIAPERRQGWQHWLASECDHSHLKEHYYDNNDTTIRYWEGYSPFAIIDEAKNYMEQQSKKEDPFFLFLSLTTPHFPHDTALPEYLALYNADSIQLPPNVSEHLRDSVMNEILGYYAHCTATDDAFAELIKYLKSTGLYDNSIIMFTSDHGEMMGAHDIAPWFKHSFYDESAKVPFLVSYPGIGDNKGKRAKAGLTTPDILPTLLSLSDITIPSGIEGYDLSGVVKNPDSDSDHGALYMNLAPFGIMHFLDAYRALKTDDYTYVKVPKGQVMLFDNKNDPYQIENLAGNEAYAEAQQKMDSALMAQLKQIGEEEIKPKEYYLEKFGFMDVKELFREDFHIKELWDVKKVVSPNKVMVIADGM